MDVWRITVAAVRRWYVLVPLLALTAVMVLAVGKGVRPEYDVTGTTMVVPGPALPRVPNPYGAPDEANNAVAIVLNAPRARAEIADRGLIPTYEVAPETRSTIMNFEVRGLSEQEAVDTGAAVFEMAAAELRARQTAAGIRTDEQYSIDLLQAPSVSGTVTEGKVRNMAVVAVLGGALSLAIAVFFDDLMGLLRRRRRRRRRSPETGARPGRGAGAATGPWTVDVPSKAGVPAPADPGDPRAVGATGASRPSVSDAP